MTKTTERQAANRGLLEDTAREAARRLTIGVPAQHRLISTRITPVQSFNGRRNIAKLVVGRLLASAYEIWPPERRPHYSVEELRQLSGITVEEVAAQLGLGRTAGYEAVRNHQIPARKLPNLDRWVVPEDVVAQMEAYDLEHLPPESLSADGCRLGSPHCEAAGRVTVEEGSAKTSRRDEGNPRSRQVEQGNEDHNTWLAAKDRGLRIEAEMSDERIHGAAAPTRAPVYEGACALCGAAHGVPPFDGRVD